MWAVPTAASSRSLRDLAGRLVAAARSTPFELHVTLLGAVEGERGHDEVAGAIRGWQRFQVDFEAVDDEDHVFRCLTLRTSSEDLARLREALTAVFTDVSPGPYRPHLSLLYGALGADERRRLLQGSNLPSPLPGMEVEAVELWDTGPDDWTEWRRLDRWALGTGD